MADQKLTQLTPLASLSADDLFYVVDDPAGAALPHKMAASVLDARYLQSANNLSDLADAATARTNLGLVAGGAGDIWVEKAGDTMTGQLLIAPTLTTNTVSYNVLDVAFDYSPASPDTTTTQIAARAIVTAGGANNVLALVGGFIQAIYGGTGRITGTLAGFNSTVTVNSGAAAGTTTNLRVANFSIQNNDADTIVSNALGVNINQPVNIGTFTNTYGLRVLNQTNSGGGIQTNLPFAIQTNGGLFVHNEAGDSISDARFEGDTDINLLFVDASADRVGIGESTPTGKLHVEQASTTAAIPALWLRQADLSEEFTRFEATVGTGNPIEAVGAKTLTVTHFIRVYLEGVGARYIAVGTIA